MYKESKKEPTRGNEMAIIVVKRVEPKERTVDITCTHCTSELKYTEHDVVIGAEDRPCGRTIEYIVCPVCNEDVTLCVY